MSSERQPDGRTFAYTALDPAGVPEKGVLSGDSKDSIIEELKSRGLRVMSLDEKKSGMNMDLTLLPKRVKPNELTIMSRQLATMISSGMTLLRAFYVLEDQVENDKLRETVSKVREDIEAGLSFSEALGKHPKVFGPLYVAMVRAGEAGGVLEESLDRVADQLEKDDALRRQVKAAMAYPAVVLVLRAVRPARPDRVHRPRVREDLRGLRRRPPDDHQDHGGRLQPGHRAAGTSCWRSPSASWSASRSGSTSEWGRPQWDRLRLRFPFKIGNTVQKIALARWSRTFAALYSAGVPIMQAIEVTGQTAGNKVVEKAMDDVIESVKSGGSIAAPLRDAKIFPPMVAQMMAVGEETGNLDTMLSKVADFYEDEVAAAVKALTSILEPLMIVFVGGIVGFIVIAMYMPMFKVYDAIK